MSRFGVTQEVNDVKPSFFPPQKVHPVPQRNGVVRAGASLQIELENHLLMAAGHPGLIGRHVHVAAKGASPSECAPALHQSTNTAIFFIYV